MDKKIINQDKDFARFLEAALDEIMIPTELRIEKDKETNAFGMDSRGMGIWVSKYLSEEQIFPPSQHFIINIDKYISKTHRSKYWSKDLKSLSKLIHRKTLKTRVALKSLEKYQKIAGEFFKADIIEDHGITLDYINELDTLHNKYRGGTDYKVVDLEPVLNSIKSNIDFMIRQEVVEETEELKKDLIDGLFVKLNNRLPKNIVTQLYRYSYSESLKFSKKQLFSKWPALGSGCDGNGDFMKAVFLLVNASSPPKVAEDEKQVIVSLIKIILNEIITFPCEKNVANLKNELIIGFYTNLCNVIPDSYHAIILHYIQTHKKIQILPEYKKKSVITSFFNGILNKTNAEEKLFNEAYLKFSKAMNQT